ncbi:MAG: hypothetical protein ACRDZ3_22420 [Acidimicrobiia bacterium]
MFSEQPPLDVRMADLRRRADEASAAIPAGYMRGSEAIRRSGVSAQDFIEAHLAGTIRSEIFAGKVRAFRTTDVEAWIASLRTQGM